MVSSVIAPLKQSHVRVGVAAAVVCLGFAAFTGHIWEDYFITFRASENLATGHGLVFQPGERVHSFTSPLGTLLPALFALGGGENVALRALWGFRWVSALALGIGLAVAVKRLATDGVARLAVLAAAGAWLLDSKVVDFSINGMEVALIIAFATWTWHALASGATLWPLAIGFAGLQWTRPDGFIYFGALAIAWGCFGLQNENAASIQRWRKLAAAVALGGALYLPWFVFAWAYYGSPIPHTILAKSTTYSSRELVGLLGAYPWKLLFSHTRLHEIFLPTAFYMGGWPAWLSWPAHGLAVGAALAWLWPRVAMAGRIASGAFFLGGFYLAYIPGFPWYFPGWQVLGFIAWAYLLHAVWQWQPRVPWMRSCAQSLVRMSVLLLLALQATLLGCVAWQMRTQQILIENGQRREIGRWLAQQTQPAETVFLECLGYIGYYSGRKMIDVPGLATPQVVATRRAGNRTFAQIINALRPDWLVMRPWEATQVFAEAAHLQTNYRVVRVFDAHPKIAAVPFLPGRGYLEYDAGFLIYRRAERPPTAPTQP